MVNDKNLRGIDPVEGPSRDDGSKEAPTAERPEDEAPPQTAAPHPVPPEETGGSGFRDAHQRGEPRLKDDSARKHGRKGLKEALEEREETIAKLSEDVAALRAEVTTLKDKWLRSAAELENYRKRTRREWELLQQRTKAEIVLDILAVLDDFERGLAVAKDRDDDFIRGIRLIYNNLHSSLERIGVRKIEALHTVFDPAYHMAVAQIERDGADSNHVIEIVQEGYCLGDFVVRPAKVVIAK